MATASRYLCRSLLRTLSQPTAKRRCQSIRQRHIRPSPFRQISSTPFRRADTETDPGTTTTAPTSAEPTTTTDAAIETPAESITTSPTSTQTNALLKDEDTSNEPGFSDKELQTPDQPYTVADLDPYERAHYETLSKEDQTNYMAVQNHVKAVMESDEIQNMSEDAARVAAREIDRSGINPNFLEERNLQALKDGYWQEDEDDEFGIVPDDDDEFSEDLITSVAESELEVQREVREYTRIAAWDLPGLLQFTRPFELPNISIFPLRFRYTTYMGESHPAQKKVVLTFTTAELSHTASLSPAQRTKLIKLLGVRYQPSTDLAKIACEKFDTQAQNKRYLGDLVSKLVAEARDESDLFEDVPLDFRHVREKKVVEFPEGWKVGTMEGVERLGEKRKGVAVGLLGSGEARKPVVDGRELVEMYVRGKSVQPVFGNVR